MTRRPIQRKSLRTRPAPVAGDFRKRYEEIEQRRIGLINRLAALKEKARAHPSFQRALTLLNATFRKSSFAKRAAVLEAADWLIDVIELWSAKS